MTPRDAIAGQSFPLALFFVGVLSLVTLVFLYVSFRHRLRFLRAGGSSSGMIRPADITGLAIVTVFLLGFSTVVLSLTVAERSTIIPRYWLMMGALTALAYGAARLQVRMGDTIARDRDLARARFQHLEVTDPAALARKALRTPLWFVGGAMAFFGMLSLIAFAFVLSTGPLTGGVPLLFLSVLLLLFGCATMVAAHRMATRDAARVLAAAAQAPAVIRGPLMPQQFGAKDAAVLSGAKPRVAALMLTVFVGGIGGLLALGGFFVLMSARQLKSWIPVQAECMGTQISPQRVKDPQTNRYKTTYSADVEYRYVASGREHTSLIKGIFSDDNQSFVRDFTDKHYRKGTTAAIVYDPADASQIALAPKSNNETTGAVMMAIGLTIVCGSFLFGFLQFKT